MERIENIWKILFLSFSISCFVPFLFFIFFFAANISLKFNQSNKGVKLDSIIPAVSFIGIYLHFIVIPNMPPVEVLLQQQQDRFRSIAAEVEQSFSIKGMFPFSQTSSSPSPSIDPINNSKNMPCCSCGCGCAKQMQPQQPLQFRWAAQVSKGR